MAWARKKKYTLRQKQSAFVRLVSILVDYATTEGYELTYSQTYRPKELAKLYEKQGRGTTRSLHCDRLAVDFNLFKKGRHLKSTKAHKKLGEFWKSLSSRGLECCWGGDWGNDGNHYSISHGGRK